MCLKKTWLDWSTQRSRAPWKTPKGASYRNTASVAHSPASSRLVPTLLGNPSLSGKTTPPQNSESLRWQPPPARPAPRNRRHTPQAHAQRLWPHALRHAKMTSGTPSKGRLKNHGPLSRNPCTSTQGGAYPPKTRSNTVANHLPTGHSFQQLRYNEP